MISSPFVKMTRSEHGIWPTGAISHRKGQIKLCRMFVLPICSMQIWRYCLFLPVLLWFPQDTSLLYLWQLAFFFRVFGERLKDTKKPDPFEQKKSSKNSRFQTAQPFNLRASFVKIQGGGERPRWRFTLCTSKKYVQTSCCRPRAQWSIEGLGRKNKWMMGGTNRGAWWWVTGNQGVFLLFKEMCGSRFLFRNMFLEGDVRWIGGIGRWVGGYMSW